MGSGPAAAQDSRSILSLMERFLRAGIPPADALRTVAPAFRLRVDGTRGVTLDALLHDQNRVGHTALAPAPAGKHLWGAVTLSTRGQIVIPKAAREMFDLKEGDRLIVLGDKGEGIALVKAEDFERKMQKALEISQHPAEP